jgi:HK97 family phage major capsid protein
MSDITMQSGLGQAVTPEEWARFVLDHLAAESVVLASGATRIDTSSKLIHVPRLTDDGGVDWYGELEDIENEAPDGDDLVLTPKKVAALIRLSNESVGDSSPAVLDSAGQAMLRAVALEADRAIFHGAGGKAPVGILDAETPLPDGGLGSEVPTYTGLVKAAGVIREAGGRPDVAYIAPYDYTKLQLEEDGFSRPLLQSVTDGPAPVVAGLRVYPTPALEANEALVAEAKQIVVAVRQDASVAFSTDAAFIADGTVARVIARLDAGVNDADGLCTIGGAGS